ncbi:MAG: Mur ligase family protein [Chlamydiota bacterium]
MRSFNDLSQRLVELHSKSDISYDLSSMQRFARRLKNPQQAYATIHVAGTNGKGSVSLKLATVLQLSGYKVGLYTSPHIHSLKERILVQEEMISEDYFCKKAEEILKIAEEEKEEISFFEIMTLLGFEYFRDQKVDVAIIEVGIGGAYDCTNIIDPCLSVITSISLDHKNYLGDTLEKIAEQKAGIIKRKIPVVVGPRVRFTSIKERATAVQAPLFSVEDESNFYDIENTALTLLGLKQISSQFQIPEEAIKEGIDIRPSCRFERIGNVIFDVAHNEDGIEKLLQAVEIHFPGRPFHVLLGMSKDKELKMCLDIIAKRAERMYLVQASSLRGASVEELSEILTELGYRHFQAYTSIRQGMLCAQEESALLIVCGSFYIMHEAKLQIHS